MPVAGVQRCLWQVTRVRLVMALVACIVCGAPLKDWEARRHETACALIANGLAAPVVKSKPTGWGWVPPVELPL